LNSQGWRAIEITDRSLDIRVQTNLQRLKIYLDTCCLSRFFDDQTQTRVYQETEVIGWIVSQIHSGHWHWISSDILVDEVERISDLDQRLQIKDLMADAHQTVSIGQSEVSRGEQLASLGFKEEDALHLACAESGSVDIFLTTDDGLLRRAERYHTQLYIRIENPYTWFQELVENERLGNDR